MALALTEPAAVGDPSSMVTSREEKLIIMYQMTKNTGLKRYIWHILIDTLAKYSSSGNVLFGFSSNHDL